MSPDQFSPDQPAAAHVSSNSLLLPTIKSWRYYLEDQNLSPHTVKAFTADLNLLATYLPADQSVGSISTQELLNFLDWLQTGRDVSCSPKTLSRRITSLKAFFRWLTQFGVLLIDPAEKVPQKTVISPLPLVLTQDEIQKVIDAAEAQRNRARPDARSLTLLLLLLSTGIKKGECLNLNINHIDLENDSGPLLYIRYPNPQHRYKERKISLPESWIEPYLEYKAQYELKDAVFPWSQRRLEYLLEDLSNEAGIDKHLSFDMCRWTCALNDWRSGMEHAKIRQKMGVSKIQWREINMKLEKLNQS